MHYLDPYYLLTFNFLVGADSDPNKLKGVPACKDCKTKEADSRGTQP
jgi:hypothetical protein